MAIRGVKHNRLVSAGDDEADYELEAPEDLFSTHLNAIPMPFNVQGPRNFYGSRFFDQALPLVNRQAPLVKNLSVHSGRSWDHELGKRSGALYADDDGVVDKVSADELVIKRPDGTKVFKDLYNFQPYNRKSLVTSQAKVKPGDPVTKGSLLATSNFTDDEGRLALGRNARIGVVAYRGETMDDALVVSQAFADSLLSDHAEVVEHEPDEDLKTGLNHFISLFPKKFVTRQLEALDPDGIVKPGTVIQPGDPVMLMTKPRSFNSQGADAGRLSRAQRFVRKDASKVWDGDDPAEVIDVVRNRKGGVKVLLRYQSPARPGDKLVLRQGNKGTISRVIPNEHMPRTEDGQPLDLLLNQLSLPSRENASSFYELLLGKVAAKTGKPYVLPSTLPEGQDWFHFIENEMKTHGVTPEERVYDPLEGGFLDSPITVGVGHILKLHHLASSKLRSRGQGSYSLDRQPLKGGSAGGGAQRLSGLEMNVLHSSGARGVQKEAVLLRGELRDDYWRALRENRALPKLDRPFVWDKFQALLNGMGVRSKDLGKGRLRLVPMTDKELVARGSVAIDKDDIVDLGTWEPKPGGLFDPAMTREQKWGHVNLPFPVVNPSYEDTVKTLLRLTGKQYEALLEGRQEAETSET